MEDVESFARRARYWIDSNIPSLGEVAEPRTTREQVESARSLQRAIFDAGFAGITWPEEFGGQNLTAAHMHAFSNALHGHENPYLMLSVSLGVIGPTLLEFGTTEQKATYLPSLLRGDNLWVQFLSEPSGGSDMAGVRTRATRDGDTWVMNGSKVWTTFGDLAEYSLCLAHKLGRAQALRSVDVRRATRHAWDHRAADQSGVWQERLLPGISRRRCAAH